MIQNLTLSRHDTNYKNRTIAEWRFFVHYFAEFKFLSATNKLIYEVQIVVAFCKQHEIYFSRLAGIGR